MTPEEIVARALEASDSDYKTYAERAGYFQHALSNAGFVVVPREVLTIVNEQANDESLWFEHVYITEDILQRALRRLHAAIESDKAMLSAYEDKA